MRRALPLLALISLAFAPAPFQRARKPEAPSARVVALMERYRTRIPPARGMGEENGLTVKELEPFLMSHLAGVARRMKAATRPECRALLPYVRDRDPKLRYIACHALNLATGAYPGGMSVGWFLDLESDGHREMARRFAALTEGLDP